ncbi:MAG: hypothetical protein MG2_0841 [uncultured Candidatus Poseidoniales archaeon]|nr:MAG: hypothetical protein MG2_0841 [uncultured Candidatus Poseidoniales archaeon]
MLINARSPSKLNPRTPKAPFEGDKNTTAHLFERQAVGSS